MSPPSDLTFLPGGGSAEAVVRGVGTGGGAAGVEVIAGVYKDGYSDRRPA